MDEATQFQTVPSLFFHVAEEGGTRPAMSQIIEVGSNVGVTAVQLSRQTLTYDQVLKRVKHIGSGLLEHETAINAGDRIALMGPNSLDWVMIDLALMSIGAVVVPLYPTLNQGTIRKILEDSGATVVITTDEASAAKIEVLRSRAGAQSLDHIAVKPSSNQDRLTRLETLEELGAHRQSKEPFFKRVETIQPSDLALIIYTSGTTGTPKGVMYEHRQLVVNLVGTADALPLRRWQEEYLCYLPLSHIYERHGHLYLLSCGAHITYSRGFDALGEDLQFVRPTVMLVVPRVLEKFYAKVQEKVASGGFVRRLLFSWAERKAHRHAKTGKKPLFYGLAYKLVLKKIVDRLGGRSRLLVSGGAPLETELNYFFRGCGLNLVEGYGLTEGGIISVNRPDGVRIGTIGQPFINAELTVGEHDELLVKGPFVARGYYNRPQVTEKIFGNNGWLHTGDQASISEDGYITISGRLKEVIITAAGKKISPEKLELRMNHLRWIEQSCALGDKRPYAVAFIVPSLDGLQFRLKKEYPQWKELYKLDQNTLLLEERVWKVVASDLAALNSELSQFETVKRVALLPSTFNENDGTLTPTQKVKRFAVEEMYADLLSATYKAADTVYKNNIPIVAVPSDNQDSNK